MTKKSIAGLSFLIALAGGGCGQLQEMTAPGGAQDALKGAGDAAVSTAREGSAEAVRQEREKATKSFECPKDNEAGASAVVAQKEVKAEAPQTIGQKFLKAVGDAKDKALAAGTTIVEKVRGTAAQAKATYDGKCFPSQAPK